MHTKNKKVNAGPKEDCERTD